MGRSNQSKRTRVKPLFGKKFIYLFVRLFLYLLLLLLLFSSPLLKAQSPQFPRKSSLSESPLDFAIIFRLHADSQFAVHDER